MEGTRVQNAHLENLSLKHRALEKKIEEEMSRPQCDTLKITEMKRKKLQLKDKITQLENNSTH